VKSDYTGPPQLPELMQREAELQRQLNEMRFNSVGQHEAAQKEMNELREHIRKLRLQGR
jgi:hypothetical protein